MSQAHRPTWNPTQGRETKAGSQQISKLSLAAHTKLKFRQPGQTNSSDVARRDLKAELAAAERIAEDKKRKAKGLPPLPSLPTSSGSGLSIEDNKGDVNGSNGISEEEQERIKRRKLLEEALEADKDDDDSDDDDEEDGEGKKGEDDVNGNGVDKGKGKAASQDDDEDEEDEDEDDDSDDEDDTAALMAELAKIKQERAEEKARMDAEAAAKTSASRDEEIATGNPLLNLQAALGQTPASDPGTPGSTTASTIGTGGFTVKRRWDDDLIFKNQAVGVDEKGKKAEFVNDLLRSEFHKKFMLKYIK